MLILSSLALVLGTVILILNVYSNRWVLKCAKFVLFFILLYTHILRSIPGIKYPKTFQFSTDLLQCNTVSQKSMLRRQHLYTHQWALCGYTLLWKTQWTQHKPHPLARHFARRKKVVCVLKSYTPRPDASVPGSPVPSERAPLTEHAMRLPHSTPTLQRGEILIQWKDGTVTPLYEAWRSPRFLAWGRRRVCMDAQCVSRQFIMQCSHRKFLSKKEIDIKGISDQKEKKNMIMMSSALCNRVGSLWIGTRTFLWFLPSVRAEINRVSVLQWCWGSEELTPG